MFKREGGKSTLATFVRHTCTHTHAQHSRTQAWHGYTRKRLMCTKTNIKFHNVNNKLAFEEIHEFCMFFDDFVFGFVIDFALHPENDFATDRIRYPALTKGRWKSIGRAQQSWTGTITKSTIGEMTKSLNFESRYHNIIDMQRRSVSTFQRDEKKVTKTEAAQKQCFCCCHVFTRKLPPQGWNV